MTPAPDKTVAPPPPPKPQASAPPPAPAPGIVKTVTIDRTVTVQTSSDQFEQDLKDIKDYVDRLAKAQQSAAQTQQQPLPHSSNISGSGPPPAAALARGSVKPQWNTRNMPTQSQNYYVTTNPEGRMCAPIGWQVIALDRGITYTKTTRSELNTGWRAFLFEGMPGTGTGDGMRYRGEIDGGNLPVLPQPDVKYGDAWIISANGMSNGKAWYTGQMAVVDHNDRYVRVGVVPVLEDFEITSFVVSPSVAETGQSVSAILTWKYNRNDLGFQNITDGVHTVAVPLDDRTHSFAFPYSSAKTFRLTSGDSTGQTDTRTAGTSFRWRRYWGESAKKSGMDESDLAAMQSELATNYKQSKVLHPQGRYMWLAWPEAWGDGNIEVNGFLDTSWVRSVGVITNNYGAATSYVFWRSAHALYGSNFEVEVK